MNNKKACILIDEFYGNSVKKLLEEILDCNVKIISLEKDINNYINYEDTCYPLRYSLNGYIKELEDGCNIILSIDNNKEHNFSYQCSLLKKLGYEFDHVLLHNSLKDYKKLKRINPNINIFKFIKCLIKINIDVYLLSKLKKNISNKIGYEINKGSFCRIEKAIKKNDISKTYFDYKNRINFLPIDKPKNTYKVLIISNNYIPNILFNNYYIECLLADKNIEVDRYYDYYEKENKLKLKYYLFRIRKYCKYNIGYNIIKNLYRVINNEYDGIIYLKPDGCASEVSSAIIIQNMCKKENIPLLFIKFNEQTKEEFIKNDINIFYDMIKINKKG